MENKIFEAANLYSDTIMTAMWTILFLGAVLAWLYFGRKEHRTNRFQQIACMLLFYGILIAGGVVGFSLWQNKKLVDIEFATDGVQTPYGFIKYNNIKNAKIQTETMASLINPNMVRGRINLLVIEEANGKAHVLSEENYPIRNIMGEIRERVKKK